MTLDLIAKTCEKYKNTTIAQKIIGHSLERSYRHDQVQSLDWRFQSSAQILMQDSVVEAITRHAYLPQKNDDWNHEYVTAAKKLEETVARNFCRVARWIVGWENAPTAADAVAKMVQTYNTEVLGELQERSLEGCKTIYFLDQTKDMRDQNLTPAQKKRLKAVGQKIDFDPQDVEELWKKNAKTDDVKSWTGIAKQGAVQTYSTIMQQIMESVGRTAYSTRESRQVLETVNNLVLPEVLAFLGTCDHSIMPKLYPSLIAAAARDNNTQYLREEVPKFWDKIRERSEKADKEAGF